MNIKTKTLFLHDSVGNRNICICAGIVTHNTNLGIYRHLHFGHSIKNPKDKFDKALAEKIAKGRSGSDKKLGYIKSTNLMLINIDVIKLMMAKLMEDIKTNPSKYIKGYKHD